MGEADATAAKRRHGRPVVTSAAFLVTTSIGATGKPVTVHNILGIDTALRCWSTPSAWTPIT